MMFRTSESEYSCPFNAFQSPFKPSFSSTGSNPFGNDLAYHNESIFYLFLSGSQFLYYLVLVFSSFLYIRFLEIRFLGELLFCYQTITRVSIPFIRDLLQIFSFKSINHIIQCNGQNPTTQHDIL